MMDSKRDTPAVLSPRRHETGKHMQARRGGHMTMRPRRSVYALEKRQGGLSSLLNTVLNPDSATSAPAADPSTAAPPATTEAPATTPAGSTSGSNNGGSTSSNGSGGSKGGNGSGNNSPAASPSSSRGGSRNGNNGSNKGSTTAAAAAPAATQNATPASVIVNGQTVAATGAVASAAGIGATASIATGVSVSTGSNGQLSTSTSLFTALPSGNSTSSSASLPFLSGTDTGSDSIAAQQTQGAFVGNSGSTSSGKSHKTVAIAVPIAVVLGLLAIGLVVFAMARHKKKMERDVWAAPVLAAEERRKSYSRSASRQSYGPGRRGSDYGAATEAGHGGHGAALGATGAAAAVYGMSRNKSTTSIRRAIRSGEFEYDDASSYGEHTDMSHGPNAGPVSAYREVGHPNTSAIAEETSGGMAAGESHGDFTRYGVDEAAYPTHDDTDRADAYYNPPTMPAYGSAYPQHPAQNTLSPYPELTRGYSNEARAPPRVSFAGTEMSTGNPDRAYGGADFLSNQYNYNNTSSTDPFQSRFSQQDDSPDPQRGAGAKMRSFLNTTRFGRK